MKRRSVALFMALFLVAGCATEGTGGSVGFYGGVGYYDDYWYGGGCCVDYPGDIGPPPTRPEHPIALPPGSTPRPEHPIATPPKAEPKTSASTTRTMPSTRSAAPIRSGGGRGGGGRR